MFAFLAGWRAYALIGIGVVVLALSGSCAFLWQVHKADIADLGLAKQAYKQISNALAESEADKALLARKTQELDAAIQERDKRLKALNEAKRKLSDELDGLRKTLPAQDQSCLTRDLPDALLGLLRE